MINQMLIKKVNLLAYGLLMVYVVECTLGCSGRWMSIGGISIRMLLFGMCFLATLPALFDRLKQTMRHPHVQLSVLFGAELFIMAVVGLHRGHNPAFVRADVTSYLSLALLPGFLAIVDTRERVVKLLDYMYYAACVMALLTAGLHYVMAFLSSEQISAINQWMNEYSLGGMFTLTTGVQRIYLKSQIFLQVALLYGVYKIVKGDRAARFRLYGCEGLLLFGCVLSYTRGFWMGMAISSCFLLLFDPWSIKRYLVTLCAGLSVFCALLGVSWAVYGEPSAAVEIVNRFDPNLIVLSSQVLNQGEEKVDIPKPWESGDISEGDRIAVDLRACTLEESFQYIKAHPVFGNGLGFNLDGIREDGKIEYTYLDITMKTGFVGLLLFLLAFFEPVLCYLRGWFRGLLRREARDKSEWLLLATVVAAYLGVACTSAVNPFLTNPMGVTLLMLVSALAGAVSREA